jgi:hypothetical protein
MGKLKFILFLIIPLIFVSCFQHSTEPADDEDNESGYVHNEHVYWDYSITVYVYNNFTSKPIPGAYVQINCHYGDLWIETGSDGGAYFKDSTYYDWFYAGVWRVYAVGFYEPQYAEGSFCNGWGQYVPGTEKIVNSSNNDVKYYIYLSPK